VSVLGDSRISRHPSAQGSAFGASAPEVAVQPSSTDVLNSNDSHCIWRPLAQEDNQAGPGSLQDWNVKKNWAGRHIQGLHRDDTREERQTLRWSLWWVAASFHP